MYSILHILCYIIDILFYNNDKHFNFISNQLIAKIIIFYQSK